MAKVQRELADAKVGFASQILTPEDHVHRSITGVSIFLTPTLSPLT